MRIICCSSILFNTIQSAQLLNDLFIKTSALIAADSCWNTICVKPHIHQAHGNCLCLLVWHNYNCEFVEGINHNEVISLAIVSRVNFCKI